MEICISMEIYIYIPKKFDWICGHLSERQQYAEVNGKSSPVVEIELGVPQGALLGPCLFSSLAYDLPGTISVGHLFMYADDTTI